ncbi:MAG: DUF2709 domain-containing protein [Waddliaceae bacterium]
MANIVISEEVKELLDQFLQENRPAELINTYLFFIEKTLHLHPVLFPKEKIIYQAADDAVTALENEDKLCHQTEIKISFGERSVNEQTKKIYICPFTGKVFGDNTHPNPQDAIYDWVSKCSENTERVGGLRVKRFFISEDPEVIKNYIRKTQLKKPLTKVVYSSALSGKLFNSKSAVIEDFKKNYLRNLSLIEVQNQNRFQIEERFLDFIQSQLVEDRIAGFVEAMAEIKKFQPVVEHWLS